MPQEPKKYLWDIMKLQRPSAGSEGVTRHNWMEIRSYTYAKVISDNGKIVVLENMYNKKRYTLKQSKAKNNGGSTVYTAIIDKKTYFAQRPNDILYTIDSAWVSEDAYQEWIKHEHNKPTDTNQV